MKGRKWKVFRRSFDGLGPCRIVLTIFQTCLRQLLPNSSIFSTTWEGSLKAAFFSFFFFFWRGGSTIFIWTWHEFKLVWKFLMPYKKNFSVEKKIISNLALHIITRIDQQIIGRFECIHHTCRIYKFFDFFFLWIVFTTKYIYIY